eukprot:2915030-Rhodomonas_salina.1
MMLWSRRLWVVAEAGRSCTGWRRVLPAHLTPSYTPRCTRPCPPSPNSFSETNLARPHRTEVPCQLRVIKMEMSAEELRRACQLGSLHTGQDWVSMMLDDSESDQQK